MVGPALDEELAEVLTKGINKALENGAGFWRYRICYMCTFVIEADFVQITSTIYGEQSLLPHEICRKLVEKLSSLKAFNHHVSIQYNPESPTRFFSLLCVLVVILHSLARLLLKTLNIMFRIRNLLPIRFDLSIPNTSASKCSIRAMISPSCVCQLHQSVRTADSELLPNSFFQWPFPSFCLFN